MKNDDRLSQMIPHNYELAGRWQINLKGWSLVFWLAGGTIVFGLAIIVGIIIRVLLRGDFEGPDYLGGFFVPLILVVFVVSIIMHEGIHGLMFLYYGGKPRFGIKLVGRLFPVAFYTTSRTPILREQYLLVILAPFMTLTLVFLVISILVNAKDIGILAIMAMAMNASSSIGDLMVAWKVVRHGQQTIYENTETGLNWYVPSAESQAVTDRKKAEL